MGRLECKVPAEAGRTGAGATDDRRGRPGSRTLQTPAARTDRATAIKNGFCQTQLAHQLDQMQDQAGDTAKKPVATALKAVEVDSPVLSHSDPICLFDGQHTDIRGRAMTVTSIAIELEVEYPSEGGRRARCISRKARAVG